MVKVDHVLMAVRDLDDAAGRLQRSHGLGSVTGGRHEEWGTANRLVPLGDSYLELITATDDDPRHPLAQAVAAASAAGDHLMAVCCEVPDIDATAARLGGNVLPGHRAYADGSEVAWRLTGVEAALGRGLPFFVQWDAGRDIRMGQQPPAEGVSVDAISTVELGGDEAVLREWLGADVDQVRFVGGDPAVRALVVRTADGEIRID